MAPTKKALTKKVTLSVPGDVLANARAYAEAEGTTLSAWVTQALRRAIGRRMAAEHIAWEAANIPAGFMDAADAASLEGLTPWSTVDDEAPAAPLAA